MRKKAVSLHPAPNSAAAQNSASVVGAGAIAQGEGAVAAGEGSVAVGGDVHGDIIVQQIEQPPLLVTAWGGLRSLARRHWVLLLGCTFLEGILLLLFWLGHPRFLIPTWLYLALAGLLASICWLWYAQHQRLIAGRSALLLATAATFVWVGGMVWQVQQILAPARFAPEQFGIAIATLGEGPDFRMTSRSRQLTGLLADYVDDVIHNTPDLADKVALRTIGVVASTEAGRTAGKRVRADLVLWGQILEQAEGTVIHYQLLEAPNLSDDPVNPLIMPITPPAISIRVPIRDPNTLTVAQIASRQNVGLTAFSLGLFYYVNELQPAQAARQFEVARQFLESSVAEGDLPAAEANLGFVYYYLGKCYQLLGRYDLSQKMLLRAAELNPEDPAIFLGIYYNHRLFGETTQAQAALQKVIDLTYRLPGDDVSALFDRAVAYEAMGALETALREYEVLLRRQPSFFVGYLSAARIHVALKHFSEAEALYTQARALAGDDRFKLAWVYLDEATLAGHEGRPVDVVVAGYQQAIALNPNLVTAHFFLAMVYESQGKEIEADQQYQEVTLLSDNPGWAQHTYAQFLTRIGKYEQAIPHFQEALRHPVFNAALIHTNLGETYAKLDLAQHPEAEALARAEFGHALSDPGVDETYIRGVFGNVLYGFGHIEEAIDQFEQALQLNDAPQPETRLNLARMYMETQAYAAARAMYASVAAMGSAISSEFLHLALEGMRQAEASMALLQEPEG